MTCEPGCNPVALPEGCPNPLAEVELRDRAYQIAVALLRAAEYLIVGPADLGCFESSHVAYGRPAVDPLCCETIAVGILPPETNIEYDGLCWTSYLQRWELVVSRCKPHLQGKTLPPDGDLTGCDANSSLSGHALYLNRHVEVLSKHLTAEMCCWLGPELCGACQRACLTITAIDYFGEEECAQLRFTIEARNA